MLAIWWAVPTAMWDLILLAKRGGWWAQPTLQKCVDFAARGERRLCAAPRHAEGRGSVRPAGGLDQRPAFRQPHGQRAVEGIAGGGRINGANLAAGNSSRLLVDDEAPCGSERHDDLPAAERLQPSRRVKRRFVVVHDWRLRVGCRQAGGLSRIGREDIDQRQQRGIENGVRGRGGIQHRQKSRALRTLQSIEDRLERRFETGQKDSRRGKRGVWNCAEIART